MPALPLELLYLIIDAHLASDRPSLFALSLVSKALVPAARHHLFHTLSLTPSNCSAVFTKHPIADFLSKGLLSVSLSTILPVVRAVDVENGEWDRRWMNETIPRLNVPGEDGVSGQFGRSASPTSACAAAPCSSHRSSRERSAPSSTAIAEQHSDVDVDNASNLPRFGPTHSRTDAPSIPDVPDSRDDNLYLPLVHTLSLSAAQDVVEQDTLLSLSRIFPNVTTLKLKDVEIEDDTEGAVARILGAFPRLETLRIDGAWCGGASAGFEDVMGTAAIPLSALEQEQAVAQEDVQDVSRAANGPPHIVSGLKTLDLVCTTPDILAAFTRLRVRVQSLQMHYLTETETPVLSNYLRFLGADLVHLTLGYLGFTPNTKLTLNSNTSLESLTVIFPYHNTMLFTSAPGTSSRTSSLSSTSSCSSRTRSRSSMSSLTGASFFLSNLALSSPVLKELTFAWRGTTTTEMVYDWIDGMGVMFEQLVGYYGASLLQDGMVSLKSVEKMLFYIGGADDVYVNGVDETEAIESVVKEEFRDVALLDERAEYEEGLRVLVRRERLRI